MTEKNRTIAFSFIANLFILIGYLVFYSLNVEMPDNMAYSKFIAEGDYTFGFMNFFLCAFIGLIQNIIYPINAFVIIHLLFSYLSFVALTFVFIDKFSFKLGVLFSLFVLSFFAVSHYGMISFTRDAGLLCATGFLVILHFCKSKNPIIPCILGGVLVLVGSQYRFIVFEVSLFVLAVYLFSTAFVTNEFYGKKRIFAFFKTLFEKKRLIVICSIIALCFISQFSSLLIDTSTSELAYYQEYTTARAAVYDYPIPDYDLCQKEYDAIGFDQNDINMNRAWYLDDGGAFTLDNLKALKKIRDNYSNSSKNYLQLISKMITTEIGSVKAIGDKGVALLGFVTLTVVFLIIMRKRYYIIPLILSITVFSLYFYLWNTDRNPPYRGVYMIWISAYLYLLYSVDITGMRLFWRRLVKKKHIKVISIILVLLFSVSGIFLSRLANFGTTMYDSNDYSVFFIKKDSSKDKQTFYFDNTYYKYINYSRHMSEFGTDNMYSNLLNNNVFFICDKSNNDSEMMQKYLNKYYGKEKTVECKMVAELDSQMDYQSFLKSNPNNKYEISRHTNNESNGGCFIYQFRIVDNKNAGSRNQE